MSLMPERSSMQCFPMRPCHLDLDSESDASTGPVAAPSTRNPIYRRAQRRRLRLEALARDGCRFDRKRKMPTLSACGSQGRVGARRNSAPRPQVFKSRNRSRGAKLTAQFTRVSFLDSGTLGVKRRSKECSDSRYFGLGANRNSICNFDILMKAG